MSMFVFCATNIRTRCDQKVVRFLESSLLSTKIDVEQTPFIDQCPRVLGKTWENHQISSRNPTSLSTLSPETILCNHQACGSQGPVLDSLRLPRWDSHLFLAAQIKWIGLREKLQDTHILWEIRWFLVDMP